ncbi:winged helix-turn-helix transcriptional regulator [Nocardia colli]|uniref:Winged helix-turn-helix transcriptional regulator n=1 Tax=Nocardia colli TaxID=2545717 RepID=A0A5N0EGR3_9NOCA|nr:winged helix-turn-helix domain-containing protein [Nocardia colli]KAA8887779.1 winged helix-turn-helix transcriptional regulator [Nocardia colli]
MKRIYCTPDDLLRIRVGAPLGAIAETMLATRVVQRRNVAGFAGWRSQVRGAMPANFGVLADILPADDSFLDLITPTRGARSISAGIEALHLASRDELRMELDSVIRSRAREGQAPLPAWTAELSDRDGTARRTVADAVEAFHSVAFAGRWSHIQTYLEQAAERMAHTLATEGVERLLADLHPYVSWRAPVLEIHRQHDCTHDEHLDGRGLVIIPSLFAWPQPLTLMSLVDKDAPMTVIVPALRDINDFTAAWGPRAPNEALTALLGRTRAAALQVIAEGCSTTELARRLGVSPATASEHASILRESGLIDSWRHRNAMRHEVTTLGAALLDGNLGSNVRIA